jgi:hypothetical protein
MAVNSANATENAETVEALPTDGPTVEPAAEPVSRQSSRTPRINTDGSMTINWLDTVRDNAAPNYSLFENLEVSVSQVQDLSYQAVKVTWTGGVETSPQQLASNYLQIMQCWDDGSGSADPTKCQFGAAKGPNVALLGSNAMSRSLGYQGEDPLQDYTGKFSIRPPLGESVFTYAVPFETAPSTLFPNGQSTQEVERFFDSTSTNEIPGARTTANGTGEATFEIQTAVEAPHLGCGAAQSDGEIRDCWLVVVPRGEYTVSGEYFQEGVNGRLMGSPLSQSNWDNRIEFPLNFRSIESNCPIGADEQRTTGNQMVTPAFSAWQSALCAKKTVFGFSMIGDTESRRNIVSDTDGAARLAFIDNPLSSTEAAGSTIVYAPAVKSALTIAFNINYFIKGGYPLGNKDGQQVTDMVLNPRLVAKLLTQSYKADVAGGDSLSYLTNNALDLRHDPEFLELNPEFDQFVDDASPSGLMVPIGNEDVFAQLWKWIKADADANAFLEGIPDDEGMVVNRNYETLNITSDETINSFPKADTATFRASESIPAPGFGTFELRPYVHDLHDGGVRAFRGDSGSKTYWDISRTPAAFVSTGAQLLGRRFMLTVTDLATAQRLGLSTAKLINPNGEPVQANAESINSAISEFVGSNVDGVKVSTATLAKDESYPLATLTYAAIDVCRASISELKSYKSLLSYIAGKGQTVGSGDGEIPVGYVPLDEAQIAQTKKVISQISAEISSPVCPEHLKPVSTDFVPTVTPSLPTDNLGTPVTEASAAATGKFPGDPNSALRYSMLSALCFGVPMIAGGRTLIRKAKTL